MDFYVQIEKLKKLHGINNKLVGQILEKSGDTFRKAMNRKSLTDLEIMHIAETLRRGILSDSSVELMKESELFYQEISRKLNIKRASARLEGDIVNEEENHVLESQSNFKTYSTFFNEKEEAILQTNSNGNKFVEKEDGTFNITVDLIPFEAYATYCESLEDATEVVDFEEVTFNVGQFGKGNYKAFTVKGDSMNGGMLNDTPDNTLVLARELGRQHWMDGFKKNDYGWIILSKHNIFHKDITGLDKESGSIICHSRNKSPEYSDFEINLNDVYQIFKVIKRTF